MNMHPLSSLFSATALAGLLASPGAAQPKTDAFMVHPILSLAISGLHVAYEKSFGDDRWAMEIPFYLGYSERVYDNATLFTGSGFGVRRYLVDAGKGTFVSPEIEVVNIHRFASGPDEPANLVVAVPSLRMGYKWRWSVAAMETGVGMAFYKADVTRGNWSSRDNHTSGLVPMGHFAVGIPF
ncbi:MAG TPA: hypothetical protein VJ385_18230 [Fibrobacteria bacterium]|nr:hypothetical protein [Fibrobacteria bacterium]